MENWEGKGFFFGDFDVRLGTSEEVSPPSWGWGFSVVWVAEEGFSLFDDFMLEDLSVGLASSFCRKAPFAEAPDAPPCFAAVS